MPHGAIHKKKDKQRKGPEAADAEYRRRLTNFDLDAFEDIILGRITKMERFNRFLVTIYHPVKKCIMEVKAAVIDKNVSRMKPGIGSLVIVTESGSTYEIYMPIAESDIKSRSHRIHPTILKFQSSTETEDDGGIEFASDDESTEADDGANKEQKPAEIKAKKDKVGKHVERLLREENDGADDDVNIDDI